MAPAALHRSLHTPGAGKAANDVKRTLLGPSGLLSILLATGCGGEPPSAALSATPASGVAPLSVRLDASASRDPDGRPLLYRFDLDGDGRFETEFQTEPSFEGSLDTAGQFAARVEVRLAEAGADEVGVAETPIEVRANRAPIAALALSVAEGKVPLPVRLDASASQDPDEGAETLSFRFDFEGDGVFDTEFAPSATAEHVYRARGAYRALVEVRDRQGLTASAAAEGPVVLAAADLAVDTNRDGRIGLEDEDGEETWSSERGAVFIANLDDDDASGERDALDDYFVPGPDSADLAPVLVRQNDRLSAGARVSLSVQDAQAAGSIKLFLEEPDGSARLVLQSGTATAELPAARLVEGDLRLWLEGTRGRIPGWDGRVVLTLRVEDEGEVDEDSVVLRVSPVIFQDNILDPVRLYVMRISDRRLGENLPFFNAVRDNLPEGIELYEVDQYRYGADRWVQDTTQTGYQVMPGPDGPHVLKTYLATERLDFESGLRTLVPQELLRPDLGYVYPGRSSETSLNYGGNLEVAPPHTAQGLDFPLGRIVVGGGSQGTLLGRAYSDTMGRTQRQWLDAQEVQGPSLEYSTEWLAVGHIDEIFLFVPNRAAGEGERPWKIMIASPDLARRALVQLAELGQQGLPVFYGRETETTVGAILSDRNLDDYNRRAQVRIDSIRERLVDELELTDEDFIEVPVLYEYYDFGGYDLAAALNPGVQNLMVAGSTLFIPDPEGPRLEGEDVWQRLVTDVTEPLGVRSLFVDVFNSYHLNLGEAHCGTEFDTVPFPTLWWEVAR